MVTEGIQTQLLKTAHFIFVENLYKKGEIKRGLHLLVFSQKLFVTETDSSGIVCWKGFPLLSKNDTHS